MKDAIGATIGAAFPTVLGGYALLGYNEWVPSSKFYDLLANGVMNILALIVILVVGLICAFIGESIQHYFTSHKKRKWQHGFQKRLRTE